MSNPPGTLGLFELQGAIGDAPVGTVYRAKRTSDGVPARVVMIERSRAGDAAYRQRFLLQAQAAAKVQHSNLEALLDGGEAGGEFFLATEWIEGLTITDWIGGHGALPEPTALEIARCCAQALKHAWDTAQLLHGGLTVDDIIVQQDGVVKLRGLAVAKPGEGSRPGDFRALGGALYQMLLAEPPPQPGHRVPNLAEKRPDLNTFAGDVLEKMLSPDPKWNFANYDEIIQDLTALIEGRKPSCAKPEQLSVSGGLSLATSAPAPAAAPAPSLSLSVSPAPAPAAASPPKPKGAMRKAGGAPTPPPPAAGGSMQLSIGGPKPGSLQLSVAGPTAPDESTLPSYAREQAAAKKKTDWKLLMPPVAALIVVGIGWFGADYYRDHQIKEARRQVAEKRPRAAGQQPAAQSGQPAQAQPQAGQPAAPAAPAAPEFDRDAMTKYRPVHGQWVELIKADCFEDAAQLCDGTIPAFRQMNQPIFVTAMEQEAADARRLLKLKDGLKANAAALAGQKLTVGSDQLTVQSANGETVTFTTPQGGTVSHPFPHVVVGRWKSWLACHAPPGAQLDRDVVIAGAVFALYALSDPALAEECLQIAATLGVDVTRYRALCKQSPLQPAPVAP